MSPYTLGGSCTKTRQLNSTVAEGAAVARVPRGEQRSFQRYRLNKIEDAEWDKNSRCCNKKHNASSFTGYTGGTTASAWQFEPQNQASKAVVPARRGFCGWFSEVLKFTQIAQVFPVGNAEVERSFNNLGNIETEKRVNLSEERNDALLK